MGTSNLFRRKSRTILTTLGIVIGTISIVVMVSLGIGMKESYRKSMESMGSLDVIDVRPSYDNKRNYSRRNDDNTLKDEDIEKISALQNIEAITPYLEMRVQMKSGRYTANVNLIGLKPEFMEKNGCKIAKGRLLNKGDELNVVFGSQVPFQFRNEKSKNNDGYGMYYGGYGGGEGEEKKPDVNVMEDRITFSFQDNSGSNSNKNGKKSKPIRPYAIVGTGILEEGGDWENRRNAFISIDELKALKTKYDRLTGNRTNKKIGYEQIKVKVTEMDKVVELQEQIKAMGYDAWSSMQYVEESNKMTNIIQMIFGGIGAVALLVAAIGITNTMVMAIYERRKEIGVMKVIGASIKDIKKLFLFEAAMIGLMGGIFGLILSLLASKGLNVLVGSKMAGEMGPDAVISIVPIWLAGLAVVFTTLIGVISGYLPARKAMKLSALEAIKTS
jgi:putative ABC transport system permease protein